MPRGHGREQRARNPAAQNGTSRRWGETPLAVVVRRPGAGLAAPALVAWTNERVGKQQRISGVVWRDSLPRNPNGKILKRELRAELMHAAGVQGG